MNRSDQIPRKILPTAPRPNRLHYGWFIIATGTLGIFACLGLARFALGMLLPTMADALELSYKKMGMLSTANFCGYLAGILFAAPLTKRSGARLTASIGLVLSGLSMTLIASCDSLISIMFLYFLTGNGSALSNIAIMALVGTWFGRSMRGKAAGFIVTGSGFAIIFSGLFIPFIDLISHNNWRYSWFVLASLILGISVLTYSIFRNSPQEMGLDQLDGENHQDMADSPTRFYKKVPPRLTFQLGIIYSIFGFTFISYATFIVTTMIQDYEISRDSAGQFWSWVGLISLVSGPLAGYFSDRFNRKYTLAAIYTVHTLAFLLVGLGSSRPTLIASIGLFGLVAWSVPSTMAALCSDYAGPEKAVTMFSTITLVFALGQLTGPYLTGLVAQFTGNFSCGYILASLLAGLAALLSLLLPSGPSGDE